jgi:isopentenyl diphosphate isomerase/L-lactate dehydrogenase-like FMN-dependent dehydrogenase
MSADFSRRAFLEYLLASPLARGVAGAAFAATGAAWPLRSSAQLDVRRELDVLGRADEIIESADEALNVFDFEPAMRAEVNAGHFAYMAQGADDSTMLRVNRVGFDKYQLLPRLLVDTSSVDLSLELFGQRYDLPVFIAPVGGMGMFRPAAEIETARAARTRNALMYLSTPTNSSVEDVVAAREGPVWFQLYPLSDWDATRRILRRAERAGCTALALTVDIPARNLEAVERFRRDSNPQCQGCHAGGTDWSHYPMLADVDMSSTRLGVLGFEWDYVDRLKEATSMKVLVKGIVTPEDADLAIGHGADGIVVSNHGGRAASTNRSTIEALPGIVAAVGGRVPVIVDSGFRRGTDVFKALAIGADGINIGRPYLWGLGAFGQAGVEKVLELVQRELRIVMQQMGTPSLAAITSAYVRAI